MAETTHPSQRTSGHKAPGILEVLNPFDVGTVGQGASEIGGKAAGVGSFVGSSRQQEKLGEEIGHAPVNASKAIAEAIYSSTIGQLFKGAGVQLVQVVLGGALLLFGIYQLGKSGASRF